MNKKENVITTVLLIESLKKQLVEAETMLDGLLSTKNNDVTESINKEKELFKTLINESVNINKQNSKRLGVARVTYDKDECYNKVIDYLTGKGETLIDADLAMKRFKMSANQLRKVMSDLVANDVVSVRIGERSKRHYTLND